MSSIEFWDWQSGQAVVSLQAGVRYVLLRSRQGAAQRTLSANPSVTVVEQPPRWQLPMGTINGAWNPSGADGAPDWAVIIDGYGLAFNQSGNHTLSFGSEQFNVNVATPPPQPDKWTVTTLWIDAAWLHSVFTVQLSYNGTSNPVRLYPSDVGTSHIFACDIESTDTYEFRCSYNQDGSADVYISPAPTGTPIATIAIVIGDTR
jgi:hypothetical protein